MPDDREPDLEGQLRRYGQAVDDAAARVGDDLDAWSDELVTRRRRRVGRIARAAAVLAALGLLGASVAVLQGGDDRDSIVAEDPQLDGTLTAADVAGRTFAVVAIELDGVAQPLPAQPPSLAFGDTSVQLRDGCEDLLVRYAVVDDRVDFDFGPRDYFAGCGGTTGNVHGALLSIMLSGGEGTASIDAGLLVLREEEPYMDQPVVVYAVDVTEQSAVGGVARAGALAVVQQMLQHLAAGDWDAASALWTGYPLLLEGDAAIPGELEQLARDLPWLAAPVGSARPTLAVTPSFAYLEPSPVVTAVSEPDGAGQRHVAAFVVSAGTEPATVVRVPTLDPGPLDPAPGTTVRPGQLVTHPGVPVEGGAVGYINGVEIPVQVDHEALTTSFRVPEWARGEIVVTLSFATPEEPGAMAAWYRVER